MPLESIPLPWQVFDASIFWNLDETRRDVQVEALFGF